MKTKIQEHCPNCGAPCSVSGIGYQHEPETVNTELLEALRAVYSDIDLDKYGSSELNIMVQEAIAKATS